MYEHQKPLEKFQEPTALVDEIKSIIENAGILDKELDQTDKKIFRHKDNIPIKQLFALYAINRISTIANEE